MEIYQAISNFKPPVDNSTNHNILEFSKGDTFEIFHSGKVTDWWGARSLKSNVTGYVPSKYMKYVERRVGKLLPENHQEEKEKKIRYFEDMQNSFYPSHPTSRIEPETPTPDYDTDDKAQTFVNNFKKILSNADIEDIEVPEPEPDYNDDGDSFPPPPPPLDIDGQDGVESLESRLNGQPPQAALNIPPADECPQIQPKKLTNPCLQSKERMALHHELLFNYKRGVNVLQKPELNKILEKRKENQRQKEWDSQLKCNKRTSLEMKLEERATKLKEEETQRMKSISEKTENTPEYLKMFTKITQKSPDQ